MFIAWLYVEIVPKYWNRIIQRWSEIYSIHVSEVQCQRAHQILSASSYVECVTKYLEHDSFYMTPELSLSVLRECWHDRRAVKRNYAALYQDYQRWCENYGTDVPGIQCL